MFDSIGHNRIDIGRDEVNSRNQFRALRAALLAGAGTTLLVAAMPAMAQDAAAPAAQEEEDAIVVTGIRERSEEHTSALQSLMRISYAVFCLKQKKPQ